MSKISDSNSSFTKGGGGEGEDPNMARNGNCFYRLWILWIRFCRAISDFIEKIFEKHTRFITKHHSKVIIGSFCFVVLMAIGGVWFNALQRNEELFIPQGSEAFKKLDEAKVNFPDIKFRVQDVILARSDNRNIINDTDLFIKALELHKEIELLENYGNVCLRDKDNKCMVVTTLEIFDYNSADINNIETKFNTWLRDSSKLLSNGRPAELNFPNILGNYKDRNITSVPRDYTEIVSTDAVRITYYTKYADTSGDNYGSIIAWEDRFISKCGKIRDQYEDLGMTLNYFAARTRDDAILSSTVGDLPLFSVAFILMVAFCLLVFFRWKNVVTGHLTVAICGICVIMLGVGCGFGLAMWIQTDFVAFTGILMFLILGIGMDNMFIIVEAMESVDPDIQGDERLVKAMKHIGGSITMTTSTDLVAFAVSTVSDFPAVHLFCVYAALSIFFAYAMLITLFLALLTWDIHRIERGQRDICPCKKPIEEAKRSPNPWLKTEEDFSKRMLKKWGNFLMKTPTKIFVFLAACGLLAAGIYGATKITQKFEWKKLSRDGSYFRNYADARDTKFPAGYDVSVILPEDGTTFDYSTEDDQLAIVALDTIAEENSKFESMTLNWMKSYRDWASNMNISLTQGSNFYNNLTDFLSVVPMFEADIKYTKGVDGRANKITASRVVFFYENNNDAINQAEAMKTIRSDLDLKSNITGIYPISIMFIYAEQFAAVLDDTIRNLAIAGGTILVITIPYLIHPGITGLVFLGFSSLLFELLGMMAAWDVSLDVIAMIIIIMAIGFSVDYTCHIAHAYMISQAETPEKRVVDALSTMGVSVLNGGVSTFLGMLITAFSGAEGFRIFFKMVFGIVVLGLIHGLVFLPVLLSIFVRRDLREDMKEFIKKHDDEERRKSQKRFQNMSEAEKRRQSVQYRGSKPTSPDNDYKMYGIAENGDVKEKEPISDKVPEKQPMSDEKDSNGVPNKGYEDGKQGTEIPIYYNNALAS
eukprot:TCONS_00030235-protein